jgi:hypothetical protein
LRIFNEATEGGAAMSEQELEFVQLFRNLKPEARESAFLAVLQMFLDQEDDA